MGTPTIALRFRDTTAGIDTISAHQKIIDEAGAVWWGWWKKDFEDAPLDFLKGAETNIELYIVDRSKSRMFRANSSQRIISSDDMPDLSLVPKYYQHSAINVFGWFLISSIEEMPYDVDIGNHFGDGTIVVLDDFAQGPPPSENVEARAKSEKSSLLVLSDLHFGADYVFLLQGEDQQMDGEKNTLTDCVIEDLKRLGLEDDIGGILVTGDFTSNGAWSDVVMANIVAEMKALSKALGVDISSLIALPGNHDVVRYPEGQAADVAKMAVEKQVTFQHERDFRFFLNQLVDRDVKAPLDRIEILPFEHADLRIGVLNSCRIVATEWTEYGYVGPRGFSVIEGLAEETGDMKTYRMIAIHHHLLPVNDVQAPSKKGVTLSLDASKILETAQRAGVQIAIHGHQHMPHLARYQSLPLMGAEEMPAISIVSNGSAGVSPNRRPGDERNTYCVLTFGAENVQLKMRELRSDKKEGNSLYDAPI